MLKAMAPVWGPTGMAELLYEVPWVFKYIPHLSFLPHNPQVIRNNLDFLSCKAFKACFSVELCKQPRCDPWELGDTQEPHEVREQAAGWLPLQQAAGGLPLPPGCSGATGAWGQLTAAGKRGFKEIVGHPTSVEPSFTILPVK